MYLVDESRVGRNKTLRTLGAVALGVVFVILLHLLRIVAQIVRDEELYIAVVVNESASLGETGDAIAEAERTMAAVHLIAVNQLAGIVALDCAADVGLRILWRRVGNNTVLQTAGGSLYSFFLRILVQPHFVLYFPIHPFVLLAAGEHQ